MKISKLKIRNFRSILSLDLDLGDTTVLIGPNNAGKTAILDAVRIVLTRRWGQRGTGFTEHDVHRPAENGDPRSLPPVTIDIVLEETPDRPWDGDMVAALDDIMAIGPSGRNAVILRVSCPWNNEKDAFEPTWQFLDTAGAPMTGRATRATNLTGFFGYVPLFWLGALRDAADEFTPRSGHWGRLLKSVHIPPELEAEALRILSELDAKIIAADPKLTEIANLIGQATRVAIGEGPGAARLNTLPMTIEEMLQRTGIVLRHEDARPWLPLGHHGQGLQSLAVIFLFQAAVLQQLTEAENPGAEAIFAIEEPEAHLHPQAARSLWEQIQMLSGQRIMTTHSPYFVQHVPLRDLRLVRLSKGCTEVSSIPTHIASRLPWNESVEGMMRGGAGAIFFKEPVTGYVAARSWFTSEVSDNLARCYRKDADADAKTDAVKKFRHDCRILPSQEDEEDLGFHGRRVRGEIFFARRWLLVEGVCEHLLVHALGRALNCPLDNHGVSVIDFQQSGNAGVYPALAEALGIPWTMIVDGDAESEKFKKQLLKRGFTEGDLTDHFLTLPRPNDIEAQLVADGHEPQLRQILTSIVGASALTCPFDEFLARLRNKKTGYMSLLAPRVASDPTLAAKMPAPFVKYIRDLRDGVV